MSDHVLRDARRLLGGITELDAELWASEWLGQAWLSAEMSARDVEHQLCMEVIGRASTHPTAHGLAAVAALRRVAPESEDTLLGGTIEILAESQAAPPWLGAAPAEPVTAWRAVDVWCSPTWRTRCVRPT